MRVLQEETVVRYWVEFEENETAHLRTIGFFPPYVGPRAVMWATQAEIVDIQTELKRIK